MNPSARPLPDGCADAAPGAEAVLHVLAVGLIVVGSDACIRYWNGWMAAATQLAASDVEGRRLEQIFPALAATRLPTLVSEALVAGVAGVMTPSLNPVMLPLKTPSGRALIHNIAVLPLGGPEPGCVIQVTDVTLVTERERNLRDRLNARYDAVVEGAPDAIVTLDLAGIVQFANRAATRQFGYPREALVGHPIDLLLADRAAWAAAWKTLLADLQPIASMQIEARRRDGSPSFVDISAAPWRSDGRVFVTAILRDANERRAAEQALQSLNQTLETRVAERTAALLRAEEALAHAQKMESLGQLTGGIAHDFNNLLTGIIGAINIVKRRIAAGRFGELDRFMDAAVTSANRAASLTHRLLAFARRQPLDLQPTNVNDLIAGMEELLRRSLGERVMLETVAADVISPALSDSGQLENALLNLVINARDAMPDGGRLTIATANVTLAQALGSGPDRIEAGDYVVIRVSDTGVGMSPATLARVFDPFFTTKPIGQGTGLGLSMIYGFAKQSRGHVRIESEVGVGTSVLLYLPAYRGPAIEPQDAMVPPPAPQGDGEAVLVVEDDAAVRLLIGEVLRELHYTPIEVPHGEAALSVLASPARIDLLISDVGLPGMNGRQLAERARSLRPGLRILFVTGYAEHAIARRAFLGPGMDMVTKPFDLEALALKIREIIEAERA